MNTESVVSTLKNALANSSTMMAQNVITSARRDHPELYNRALSEYNADMQRLGRPVSKYTPVVLATKMPTNMTNDSFRHSEQKATNLNLPTSPASSASPLAVSVHQQTVNNTGNADMDDSFLESIDEEEDNEVLSATTEQPDYDEFDENIEEAPIEELESDDSMDDEEDIAELSDDGESELHIHPASDEDFVDEDEVPETVSIENLNYKHEINISIYLDSREGSIYEKNGTFLTTHQPLRRGKGQEKDATGAVRAALDAFVEGVSMEGDSIRFGVAVPSSIAENYVYEQARGVESRLNQPFDEESGAVVTVATRFEQSEGAWGGTALTAIRSIDLHFAVPAIVAAARKNKDEMRMLLNNLKVVNTLVARLKEATAVSSVQVNILIQDDVTPDLLNIFQGLIAEGSSVRFDRGYAVFTVKADSDESGEAEE